MKSKNFKRLTVMCLIVSMMVTMIGCGKKTDDKATGTTPEATQAVTKAPEAVTTTEEAVTDEAISLSFMHFSTPEEVAQKNAGASTLVDIVAQWEAANPNVTLEQNALANADYKTKAQTLAAAGDLPDVFLMQGSWTKDWVAQGLVTDLTDTISAAPGASEYRTEFFAPFQADGKTYGIPILAEGTCSIVMYDAALFKEAGFDSYPTDWAGLQKASEYFKTKGIDTVAFGNSGTWQYDSCFLSAMGNRFTGDAWTKSIINKDGTAKFTDENFVKALQWSQDIFKSGVFNKDFATIDNVEARALYVNGQAASFIGGNWDVSAFMTEADKDLYANTKFAVIPQPEGATATTNTHDSGLGYAICINPKLTGAKLEAAKDLALTLTGGDYATYLAENWAMKSVSNAAAPDLSKFDQLTQDLYNFYENPACDIYDSYMDASVIETLNTGAVELLNGNKTAADLAAEVQAAYEAASK